MRLFDWLRHGYKPTCKVKANKSQQSPYIAVGHVLVSSEFARECSSGTCFCLTDLPLQFGTQHGPVCRQVLITAAHVFKPDEQEWVGCWKVTYTWVGFLTSL